MSANDRGGYTGMPDVETSASFGPKNIREYYLREILHEKTDEEKTTQEILKDAAALYEYLRSYGGLTAEQKPHAVPGILPALREVGNRPFSIGQLNGDTVQTDGRKIFEAIRGNLMRADVTPDAKRYKLPSQFEIIKRVQIINVIDDTLGKTPLRYYTEFLYGNVFKNLRYHTSSEDCLGSFYGEFFYELQRGWRPRAGHRACAEAHCGPLLSACWPETARQSA